MPEIRFASCLTTPDFVRLSQKAKGAVAVRARSEVVRTGLEKPVRNYPELLRAIDGEHRIPQPVSRFGAILERRAPTHFRRAARMLPLDFTESRDRRVKERNRFGIVLRQRSDSVIIAGQ